MTLFCVSSSLPPSLPLHISGVDLLALFLLGRSAGGGCIFEVNFSFVGAREGQMLFVFFVGAFQGLAKWLGGTYVV